MDFVYVRKPLRLQRAYISSGFCLGLGSPIDCVACWCHWLHQIRRNRRMPQIRIYRIPTVMLNIHICYIYGYDLPRLATAMVATKGTLDKRFMTSIISHYSSVSCFIFVRVVLSMPCYLVWKSANFKIITNCTLRKMTDGKDNLSNPPHALSRVQNISQMFKIQKAMKD